MAEVFLTGSCTTFRLGSPKHLFYYHSQVYGPAQERILAVDLRDSWLVARYLVFLTWCTCRCRYSGNWCWFKEVCKCALTWDGERKQILWIYSKYHLKGCGMGTLFVLVSPCFRENVVVTYKIGSFLCSLDNLLQKNVLVIVFFFGSQISKWRSFEKRGISTYFSHFLVTREKLQNSFSTHLTHIVIHVFCSPYWLFLPYQSWKKIRIC